MGNIAFVASTLPIPILKNKINDWDIDEIIVSSDKLKKPFLYLLNNSKIKLIITPNAMISNFIFIFFKLLISFFCKKKVYFFHECCWFNFDFLIDFIKVKAFYYPQVTLKSFEKVENIHIQSKFQKYVLYFFNCTKTFIQYKVIEDNNEGYYFVLSKKNYNNNVQVYSIAESLHFRIKNSVKHDNNKNILILLSRETVSDILISSIYEKIINILTLNDFKVFIKNHPRENSRLRLNNHNVYKEYDPNLPFELIEDSFMCIIGCASTSLINKSQPIFSIINFTGMNENLVKMRINHLLEIAKIDYISFPVSIDDLILKIKEIDLKNQI